MTLAPNSNYELVRDKSLYTTCRTHIRGLWVDPVRIECMQVQTTESLSCKSGATHAGRAGARGARKGYVRTLPGTWIRDDVQAINGGINGNKCFGNEPQMVDGLIWPLDGGGGGADLQTPLVPRGLVLMVAGRKYRVVLETDWHIPPLPPPNHHHHSLLPSFLHSVRLEQFPPGPPRYQWTR